MKMLPASKMHLQVCNYGSLAVVLLPFHNHSYPIGPRYSGAIAKISRRQLCDELWACGINPEQFNNLNSDEDFKLGRERLRNERTKFKSLAWVTKGDRNEVQFLNNQAQRVQYLRDL